MSIDADHLAGVFLVGQAYKAAVLTDSFLNELLVFSVGSLLFHEAGVLRVVEGASVGVNGSLFQLLNDRLITFFKDNNQLGDELKVV